MSRFELARVADPMRPQGISDVLRPNFPSLAANMTERLTGRPFLKPTLIKTVGGVKVGFIGITSDIVKEIYPLLALGFDFTQGDTFDKYDTNLRAPELQSSSRNE